MKLERIQFGESLLLLVLAGGLVALVDLRLRVLSIGIGGLRRGLRSGSYIVDSLRCACGLFSSGQRRCVFRSDGLQATVVVGRGDSHSRCNDRDAHAVSTGGGGAGRAALDAGDGGRSGCRSSVSGWDVLELEWSGRRGCG